MVDEPTTDGPHRLPLVSNVMGAVVPAVIRQIDTNDLLEGLDVDAIAAELDLDALIARMDVDAIAEQLDLDALIARMDVDAIAEQLDLDALIARMDIDAIAERLDLDALIARMDITALAKELDMAEIAGGATQDVAVSGLDLFRRQIIRADATVDGVIGRILRRKPDERPAAPGERAQDAPEEAAPEDPHELQRRDVTGHYAGPVTRILAVIADVFVVLAVETGVFALIAFVVNLFTDVSDMAAIAPVFVLVVWLTVFVAWFWFPVAFFGRTLAMAFLGLAVVKRDGTIASGWRAFSRALFFPVSVLVPLMFIGLLVGKERRALHDVVAGTVVIYDWGAREAEQPVSIRQQLSARAVRRHDELTAAAPVTEAASPEGSSGD